MKILPENPERNMQRENVIIPNEKELGKKIEAMASDGADKLHILSDFDRTLTQAFVDGQKSPTVIAQIRNGKYLTSDYALRAHALYDKYRPIEIDSSLDLKEKNKAMHEWWKTHFELLVECGLDKKVMDEIVSKRELQFRAGTLKLFDLAHKSNVPVIIMSAGPGYMIRKYIEQEGRMYANVHIIANEYDFNDDGKVLGIKEPIIHSYNKHEMTLDGHMVLDSIRDRKNVVLLGDGVSDIGMVEGFSYDHLLTIGFLNENKEVNGEKYGESFDVVLTGDQNMDYVHELLSSVMTKGK